METIKTEKARKLYNALLEIGKMRDMLVWEEAKLLTELHDTGLFRYVFGHDEENSWSSFIKQTEFPKSTVDMKTRMYDFWVKEKNVPVETLSSIHTRKLDRAITKIKEGKITIADAIDTARKVSFLDFKKWLDDLK